MIESNPRPPEVQSIVARPFNVAEVIHKYRAPRPGETTGEDDVPPGYGRLPDPVPPSVVYDALRAAVASFGVTGEKAERLRIWLQNNLTAGRFIDKAEMERRKAKAIEAERAAHPDKDGKGWDGSSYKEANGDEAFRQWSDLEDILETNVISFDRQEAEPNERIGLQSPFFSVCGPDRTPIDNLPSASLAVSTAITFAFLAQFLLVETRKPQFLTFLRRRSPPAMVGAYVDASRSNLNTRYHNTL
jgi:hypothetical protein